MAITESTKTVYYSDLTGGPYESKDLANKAEFSHLLAHAIHSDAPCAVHDCGALAEWLADRYPELWEDRNLTCSDSNGTALDITNHTVFSALVSRVWQESSGVSYKQGRESLKTLFESYDVTVKEKK